MRIKSEDFRPATEEERKALGVPPAYTDVRIARRLDGADLLAVATIPAKGGKPPKTFYKYSAAHVARQAAEKYLRVAELAKRVHEIDAEVRKDIAARNGRYALAISARLVMLSGMRAGNPPQGEGESFGTCNLLLRHVTVTGNSCRFQFIGKKGVPQDVSVTDQLIASYVLAGREEGHEALFPHSANALLRYLKKLGCVKTHDLRTLRAMLLADDLLKQLSPERPKTKREAKLLRKLVATEISKVLGNAPTQVIKSYVSESIWPGLEED